MAAVAHPTRPQIRRNSPLSVSNGVYGFSADAPMLRRIDIGDSDSDDEPPPAIKFSKETQALLADAPILPSSPPRQQQAYEIPRFNRSVSSNKGASDTPSRAPGLKIVRRSSPVSANGQRPGSTPPRVVHVGSKGPASAKRSISVSAPYAHRLPAKREPTPTHDTKQDFITPAPAPRALRVRTRSNSVTSQDGNHAHGQPPSRPESRNGPNSAIDHSNDNEPGSELRRSASQNHGPETLSKLGQSTTARSRNTSADPAPPPGSTRIKRAPITGSFLKSGPVRRGFRRRESEEYVSPLDDEVQIGSASQPSGNNYTPRTGSATRADGRRSRSGSVNARAPSVEPVSVHDFAQKNSASYESRASSRLANSYLSRTNASGGSRPPSRNASDRPPSRQSSVERPAQRSKTGIHQDDAPAQSRLQAPELRPSVDQGQQRPALDSKLLQRALSLKNAPSRQAAPRIHTDASEDQENMPPPTFRRNKDAEFKHLGKQTISVLSDDEGPKARHVEQTPVPVPGQQQEPRRVLGAISGNTPHRAAPAPPPKMSVIDTATTTAGASVTKSKKKRTHIVINGKIFTKIGELGTGGSASVHYVMAENWKTFALKRVKLKDADETAIRGYKGEIDLLQKLSEVERVVRLFDWELNNDKQELLLLMEKGDTDFNRLFTIRINGEGAKFDPVFTRYHWREMLECVQAVHDKDIVHSDLKPANFLLVKGRLKLIDFGIANAIDTDNTVNVHRDTHVGTPNYMSPESIRDNGAKDKDGRTIKDITIGKASDVWSLGCILYQMTYGKPPFAHIQNQLTRIVAITDPKHEIKFPETGIGGALIPPSLRGTLRKCLNRDATQRPTTRELLGDDDLYLNPDQPGSVIMTEDLLSQIIHKVAERFRDTKKEMPTAAEVENYPRSFMVKIQTLAEQG